MKKLYLLLFLAFFIPHAHAQTSLERCQAGACYGFGAPTGSSLGGYIYQDVSQTPPALYCSKNNAWVACGGGGSSISLTTSGTSGLSTLIDGVLNIPNYTPASLTAAAMATAISSQTGCTTSGFVWVPASNTCVAQSGGGGGALFPSTSAIVVNTSTTASRNAAAADIRSASSMPNTYLVCEGDSRIANSANAGANSGATQDVCSQIQLQSNFVGVGGAVDLAVGGSTCAGMTARYAAGAHNYRPGGSSVPSNITRTLEVMEIGVNDLRVGVTALTEEACVNSYIATAAADGITVIPMTVYWYGGYTDPEAAQSNIFNDWERMIPFSGMFTNAQVPFVFDYDLYFPPENASPYYYFASTPVAVTSETVSSLGLSVVTGTQAYTTGTQVLLSGFPSGNPSACLNGQQVVVTSTGLSTTTFQAPIGCPNFTATDTGVVQTQGAPSTGGNLHMGPNGNAVAAQEFNLEFGLAESGSSILQPNFRDTWTPPSGQFRINGCITAGGIGFTSCPIPGALRSMDLTTGLTGIVYLGSGGYIRNSGTQWVWNLNSQGPLLISAATGGMTYSGGGISACIAGATCTQQTNGGLTSISDTSGASGIIHLGTGSIFQTLAGGVTWTANGAVTLNQSLTTQQFVSAGTAPTITNGPAAGTGPGTPTAVGSTSSGVITINTGTVTTASAVLATINFAATLVTAPHGCSLMSQNANAASAVASIYTTAPTTTTWTIAVGLVAVPASSTLTYSYICL